jgi:2-hydroxychromene-2-carboxylate isomerase
MADIERRTRSYGLPPMRWPDPWPTDYLFAMRAATFAFAAGRGREFTMQAYRNAFQQGRQLGEVREVMQAARQAGIDEVELEAATREAKVKQELRQQTDSAHSLGVIGVPTIAIGDELFWGDDRLVDRRAPRARDRGLSGRMPARAEQRLS